MAPPGRRRPTRPAAAAVTAPGRRMLAAPDKFRETATASELAAAAAAAAAGAHGWACTELPMADGGEGTLDVLATMGGTRRRTIVSGPLGDPVEAEWLLVGTTAYLEMARASGLVLVGGAAGNDPLSASTYGTGELINAAVALGARRVVVTVGGSATTDGGFGALRALEPLQRLRGIDLVVACDVETRFVDAAEGFGPQKGASPAQVALLKRRLERLAGVYREERDVDVADLPGSGAAGGLAGGLASIGAHLVSGFSLVADVLGLAEAVHGADLVVTGEGFLDEHSFAGKVVGGVCELAAESEVPVLVVAGDVLDGFDVARVPGRVEIVSLVERFGRERAWSDPTGCLRETVAAHLCAGVPPA